MNSGIEQRIKATKAALMGGDVTRAAENVEHLMDFLRTHPPEQDSRDRLEARLTELRCLAEAALEGTRAAAEEMRGILQTARSLETYDRRGRRKRADTASPPPRRF